MSLLHVKDLTVQFKLSNGPVFAVRNVGFSIASHETLGVVGESGSGKSQLFLAIFGLLAANGTTTGQAYFQGQSILNATHAALNKVRGKKVGFVFQDPMGALHPKKKIASQLCEVLQHHEHLSYDNAYRNAIQMLDAVKMPHARSCMESYSFELSGGMRQRVMIAMALLCRPHLIIADEPTTALDVSTQAQILCLLKELQREFDMSIVLISHDLGVIAGMADRAMVMYGGSIMESGTAEQILLYPRHPYTKALLDSMPNHWEFGEPLKYISGSPPELCNVTLGCPFQDRCTFAEPRCEFVECETLVSEDLHYSACPFQ